MTPIDLKHPVEDEHLAPWAARSSMSRGRKYQEERHPYRSEFQRDRERIIHSRAFRRLEYKTQVFINHEGDHYRTRLTHTIEVSQIARTMARAMRLNEDLAESIALAHDLGHTPFGHAGERELNRMLEASGGFEHNRQSLRVVDILEKNYQDFPGLNLTWETREGIIKHSPELGPDYREEFIQEEMPSLEGQLIDLADEIAYNNHDLDDGISSGILAIEEVTSLRLWHMARERYRGNLPSEKKLLTRIIVRAIINLLATDLMESTLDRMGKNGIENYEDIRKAKIRMTGFSDDVREANQEVKRFLMEKLYRHYRVTRMSMKAEKVIRELFRIYTAHPDTLPEDFSRRADSEGPALPATDYIAGMTDRFAIEEHKKLTDPTISV
jgi:dGTPase